MGTLHCSNIWQHHFRIIIYSPSRRNRVLLQCSVLEGDLHCQCILSIFPGSVHQFYANLLVFININPFLYINDQFALYSAMLLYLHLISNKIFFHPAKFDIFKDETISDYKTVSVPQSQILTGLKTGGLVGL